MLEKLYNLNALDLSKLVLKYKKDLNLTSEEIVILLSLSDLLKTNSNKLESNLATILNIDNNTISNSIAHFMELGYLDLEIVNVNGIGVEKYSIIPLLNQLEVIINDESKPKNDSKDIFMYIENLINRSLSSKELETINEWLDYNISLSDIKRAEKSLSVSGINITVSRLEKELFKLNGHKSSNIEKLDQLIEKNKNGRILK